MMNERIKQLIYKADEVEILPDEDFCDTDFLADMDPRRVKIFAELIVRECLKELRYTVVDTQECRQDKSTDYQVGWEDGMFDAGETIKQHFGVEE